LNYCGIKLELDVLVLFSDGKLSGESGSWNSLVKERTGGTRIKKGGTGHGAVEIGGGGSRVSQSVVISDGKETNGILKNKKEVTG
jgi:hypothetical protein